MIIAMKVTAGRVIKIGNELLLVLKKEIHRWGRWSTNIKVRMKNVLVWNTTDRVFDSEEKLDDVILDRSKFEFLYQSWDTFYFMDQENYEQIELTSDDVGDAVNFMTPWLIVDIQRYEWKLIWVILPTNIKLLITESEPWVKGNTADWKVIKEATLETGYNIKVPGFVEAWEYVIINTETWEYSERAKKD